MQTFCSRQSCTTLKFQLHSLISIRTGARSLIIFGTIDVWAVVERPVPSADGPSPPLVQEVPVETGKGPVLCTFMLYEQGALLSSEFLQISWGGGSNKRKWINVTFLDSDIVLYSFSHRRECIHMYLQYIPYTCYSSTQLNKLSRDPLFVLLHLVLCCCDKSYNSLYIM